MNQAIMEAVAQLVAEGHAYEGTDSGEEDDDIDDEVWENDSIVDGIVNLTEYGSLLLDNQIERMLDSRRDPSSN